MSLAVARAVVFGLGWTLMFCACKQSAPALVEPTQVRAKQAELAQPEDPTQEPRPVRDPFELDESSDDPAAALEANKHNCCDEMPADELRQHVHDPAKANAPGPERRP